MVPVGSWNHKMVQCSSPLHRWIIWRLSLASNPQKVRKTKILRRQWHMTFFSIFLGMTHVIHGHSMIFNAYGGTSAVTSQMLRHLRFQAEVMVQAVANQWMVYGYFDTAELMFSRKWNQQINGLVSWFRWLGTFWTIPPGISVSSHQLWRLSGNFPFNQVGDKPDMVDDGLGKVPYP